MGKGAQEAQEKVRVDSWGQWNMSKKDVSPEKSKVGMLEVEGLLVMDDVLDIEEIAPPVVNAIPPPAPPPSTTPVKDVVNLSTPPQLLTPDHTPKRAKLTHAPSTPTNAAMQSQPESESPPHILPTPPSSSPILGLTQYPYLDSNSSHVWFAKPHRRKLCRTFKAAQKGVSSPMYSVHDVFAGCGWTKRYGAPLVSRRIIAVDECDADGVEKVRICVGDFLRHAAKNEKRVEVVVYGCCSGTVLNRFM